MPVMKIKTDNAGFTLIEMIAALLLLGIIGVFGSMFLVNMVRSYQWANDNAHLAQKAQVALTRIAVEMSYANAGTVQIDADDNIILYNATYLDGNEVLDNRIERNGSDLVIVINETSYRLTDRVEDFNLEENGSFTVRLVMRGANDIPKTFEKSITPP